MTYEQQYLALIRRVLNDGVETYNQRTGETTLSVFDHKLTASSGEFPFSTVRPASPRLAFEELWLFLNGKTNTKELESKGVNFWKGNTSREFLDANGLNHLPEGDLGAAYSKQFRDFGDSEWGGYYEHGIDQVEKLVDTLKTDRYSRRLVTSLWNPAEEHLMVLTPCWMVHQFVVLPSEEGDVLHLKLTNRSLDIVFGCMFAVQQYRLYQIALAHMSGMKVGNLSCDLSHVHIYNNQIDFAYELLTRKYNHEGCYDMGRVQIKKELNNLDDLLALTWEDWVISMPNINVTPFVTPRPEMVA